jgi:hypothetical protein
LRQRQLPGSDLWQQRFIGVEFDRTLGRIARVLHPRHDVRIENFRNTRLPEGGIDAVIGSVPLVVGQFNRKSF